MIKILATDLDGTLIPLDGVEENKLDLQNLKNLLVEREIGIIFVTGRHIESVQEAIAEHDLPIPQYIIADVGSSIYKLEMEAGGGGLTCKPLPEYSALLDTKLSVQQYEQIRTIAEGFNGVRLQEPEKLGRHKLSFYADAGKLKEVSDELATALKQREIPFSMIVSVDPFNGDGLIDILPRGITKSFALDWFLNHIQCGWTEAIFSGDSGNDYAAMVGGFNTIVVGNAGSGLKSKVVDHFNRVEGPNGLYCAEGKATSGVLEGVQNFLADD